MKYTAEQLSKAKQEELPLFKIDLDFRYAKKVGGGTKSLSNWGACTPEVAEKLRQIIRDIA